MRGVSHVIRSGLVVGWLLLAAALPAADEPGFEPAAAAAYAQGQAAEETARNAPTPADAQTALRAAIAKYREALATQADWRAARERLAACLVALLELTEPAAIQADDVAALGAELDALAKHADASADDFVRLAAYLTRYRYTAAREPADRKAAFQAVRETYQQGIERAEAGAARAGVQVRLASLMVTHAGEQPGDEANGELYHAAAALFESAATAAPAVISADLKNVWGVALLHVGRLDSNPAAAQRALKLMEESLEGQKGDLFKRYNLACAYAVLGERDKALATLALCLKEDQSRVVFRAALEDPEWKTFRDLPAFQQVLQPYDPRADQAFGEAITLQSSGERAAVAELKLDYLVKAYQQYRAAVQLRPTFYRAHYNALLCLRQLLGLIGQAAERQQVFGAMREHFQAAAQLPEADWTLFDFYGRFLSQDGVRLAGDAATRLDVLREAKRVLDEALKRVAFTGDRARVANSLATCEVFLGRELSSRSERRAMLTQSVQHFEMAIQIERVASTPEVYASWGVAQLELAKLEGNRFGLRQAIERFQMAIKSDPRQLLALYNLACTYALLGQQEEAMLYLTQCLQNDTEARYTQLAATDPDFEKLRERADFKALLARPSYGRPIYIGESQPPVSGR